MKRFRKFSANIFPSDLHNGISGSIELNILLAQLCGLPFYGLRRESLGFKVIFSLYGIVILILMTFLYSMFELYDLVLSWPRLDDVTQTSSLFLTHAAGIYKIGNTFYRLNDIARALDKLRFINRHYLDTDKKRQAYFSDELENKMILLVYFSIVAVTGITGIGLLYYRSDTIAGKSFPYHVFLPKWLPFHARILYMGFGVLILGIQVVCVDYLNMSLMNQIRSHLNIINLSLDTLVIPDIRSDEREILKSIKSAGDPNDSLLSIVEHHCLLKDLRDDIEDIFRMPLLIQFGASLFILVLAGFQATERRSDDNGTAIIYIYCFAILLQLFFYCWFGNEVSEQNKTVAVNGAGVTWYKYDLRFQKSLNFFITNAQRPILFTAGGFMNLALPSFAGVLSKAYTYIAVLRQIKDG